MICYKDQTFCRSDCTNTKCFRNFTDTIREDAIKWWGSEEAPIAFADFSTDCNDYIPLKEIYET